jgi:hypothetical protein
MASSTFEGMPENLFPTLVYHYKSVPQKAGFKLCNQKRPRVLWWWLCTLYVTYTAFLHESPGLEHGPRFIAYINNERENRQPKLNADKTI